jgi:hypothetical protein
MIIIELACQLGISEQTYYHWNEEYGVLDTTLRICIRHSKHRFI